MSEVHAAGSYRDRHCELLGDEAARRHRPHLCDLTSLPVSVSATWSPPALTFSPSVRVQQSTATLTVPAGTAIPDGVVQIVAADLAANRTALNITLLGACPRHNKDVLLKGAFYATQHNMTFPIEGIRLRSRP